MRQKDAHADLSAGRVQEIQTGSRRRNYHRGRIAFQDDHARDLALRRLGFDVHRFSEQQLNEQPEDVVADLRAALGGEWEV